MHKSNHHAKTTFENSTVTCDYKPLEELPFPYFLFLPKWHLL